MRIRFWFHLLYQIISDIFTFMCWKGSHEGCCFVFTLSEINPCLCSFTLHWNTGLDSWHQRVTHYHMIVFKSLLIKLCADETFPQHVPVCDVMNSLVWGRWQCCLIDRRVTCAVLMGWGQNLCPDPLTCFTLSALSADTNTVLTFWHADGRMVGLQRMDEDDGRSKGKLVLLHSHKKQVGEQRKASGLVSRCARRGVKTGGEEAGEEKGWYCRRTLGRGCRQTGRVTRGRRWPSLLLEDRRLYLKAWSMLGAAEVSASQPGDSSPL